MSQKYLEIITKIILIYSIFYVGLKIAAIFQGAWLEANLLLALPFVLLGGIGGYLLKSKKSSWIFAISGILIIGVTRFFEKDWAVAIHNAIG